MNQENIISLKDDYIFHIEKVLNYSSNTVRSYGRDLNVFIEFCRKIDLEKISLLDDKIIREFVSYLHRNGISPKSIKRHLSSLRGFFNFLLRKKIIVRNFAENTKSPKAEKHLPEVLQHKDIDLLASQNRKKEGTYKNKDLLLRDLAIFELFYSSGLRLSELANVKFENINFEESIIRIVGKGQKTRLIPLGSKAILAIKSWIEARKKFDKKKVKHIFIGITGDKLTPRSIQLRMNTLAKASGIDQNLYPHKLRHTVATHLLESSGNIRAVQEFLGHENISTTQIYTHLDNQYLMTVYDKVHPRSKKILKEE